MQKTDADFLRAMIVHHNAAVAMSKKYLADTNGSRRAVVADLARAVVKAQTDEIGKMKKWLVAAGESTSSGGMKM